MEAPATCKIYLTFNHNRNRFVLCSNSLTGRFRLQSYIQLHITANHVLCLHSH